MTRFAILFFSVASLSFVAGCGDDSTVGPCGAPLCAADAAPDVLTDAAPSDASPDTTAPDAATPVTTDAVIDAAWLLENLDDPSVQVVDVRSSADFAAAHAAGARLVDPNALRATVDGVPGQVADMAAVEAEIAGAGLNGGGTVVVYGAASEPTPARVVWTLAYYGHEDVRLLDGGFPAFEAVATTLESGGPTPSAGDWTAAAPVDALRVDVDYLLPRLDDPTVVLVDARTSSEYDAGHIPGALSIDWTRNVSDGAYLPSSDVAALYADIDRGATLVAYCQTGSRASLTWLTLQWLGFTDVRLYDGSWAEWGSRPELPSE